MTAPTTVALRPMTLADLPEILRLERELFGPEAWTAGMMRDELADPGTRHYRVLTDPAGRILGYAGLARQPDEAHVMTIGVVPDARRLGLGSRLLIDLLAAAGDRPVLLEVEADNAAAQRLYAAHGFAAIGRRRRYYQATGADAVVMRRPGPSGVSGA